MKETSLIISDYVLIGLSVEINFYKKYKRKQVHKEISLGYNRKHLQSLCTGFFTFITV